MSKKLSKWERDSKQRQARRISLNAKIDAAVATLRELADTLRATREGDSSNHPRVESMATTLAESAHYSMRKLRAGNYIR